MRSPVDDLDEMTAREYSEYLDGICWCDKAIVVAQLGAALRMDEVTRDNLILMRARARQLREALDSYEQTMENLYIELSDSGEIEEL